MSIVYGYLTCDGAKNLAESFSVQLSERFKPCSTACVLLPGIFIMCRNLVVRSSSVNLPMPKFFPLINYCCGCPLRCCLRLTFSVRSMFRAFNNPRSMKQPFSPARPQIVSGARCFVSICFTAKDTNFLAFGSFMGQ